MDFSLTPDQIEIRDLAMKFARNEMMPKAQEFDEKATMPMEILTKAWELGLINTCIPTEYGGNGFTAIDSMIITEALAYGCMGMNTAIMANDLALLPIVIGGNDEQKKRFLTPFTESYIPVHECRCQTDGAGGMEGDAVGWGVHPDLENGEGFVGLKNKGTT